MRVSNDARQVVLITGASKGIGAACVSAFRARGARVALAARSAAELRMLARDGDLVLPGDLTHGGSGSAVEQTVATFGRIDVLVNCAGVGLYVPSHQASETDARAIFDLNFFTPLRLSQLAAAHMKRQRSGAIVNVSSVAGKVSLPWFTLYSATKHALEALTDGLRVELRGHGIHCMSVCPGYARTEFQRHVLAGEVPPALGGLKHRWSVSPEQCAEALVRGLERRARTVVVPRSAWLLIAARTLAPGLVDRQFERMYLSGSTAQ
jgi:short-subunit dehydrogenase